MDFKRYQELNQIYDKSEIDRVFYIGCYIIREKNKNEFSLDEVIAYLRDNGYPNPNITRLRKNLKLDKRFVCRGANYCIAPKTLSTYKDIVYDDFESVSSNNEFLDESIFPSQHSYLMRLVKQVNASYKHNLFDATAVLIRRIFEILLIKTYQKFGIDDKIKVNKNYVALEKIIDDAVSNSTINLSRSRIDLNQIRNIGNFAAHKIEYNTNKNDLDKIKDNNRVIVEELLYKSGLKQ